MIPYLNADIPRIPALIRAEFLYDMDPAREGEYEQCVAFAVASIAGRAPMFHTLLANGAQVGRVPLHALCWKDSGALPLQELCLWDAPSYHPSVLEFGYLSRRRCAYRAPGGAWRKGEYLFTLDWAGSEYAEDAGEHGWKSAHVIRLDSGHFAAQPNNRMVWYAPEFVTEPWPEAEEKPRYRTMSRTWSVEGGVVTEDSDAMLYEVAPHG